MAEKDTNLAVNLKLNMFPRNPPPPFPCLPLHPHQCQNQFSSTEPNRLIYFFSSNPSGLATLWSTHQYRNFLYCIRLYEDRNPGVVWTSLLLTFLLHNSALTKQSSTKLRWPWIGLFVSCGTDGKTFTSRIKLKLGLLVATRLHTMIILKKCQEGTGYNRLPCHKYAP